MDDKIIVVVRDRQDGKHGEISVLDDPQKAARLVETLLEAGFEQERIQVFSGQATEFQVSQRPVVALGDGAERSAQVAPAAPPRMARRREESATAIGEEAAGEEAFEQEAVEERPNASEEQEPAESHRSVFRRETPEAVPEQQHEEPVQVAGEEPPQSPSEPVDEEPQEEDAEAEPVRFSSLFRSA